MSNSKPINTSLYSKVKAEAKRKFKVYPSAYANGWLVKEYKRRGGRYKYVNKFSFSRSGNLSRWFQEKWVDTCKLPKKVPCGRKKSSQKKYPYCRPIIRISPQTPKTVSEIGIKELKRRCAEKRKNPSKRLIVKSRSRRSRSRRSKLKIRSRSVRSMRPTRRKSKSKTKSRRRRN